MDEERIEKRIIRLEQEIEFLRLDIELFINKSQKDIRRLDGSISAHRGMLMDLKPIYDEFKIKKLEIKKENERSYG